MDRILNTMSSLQLKQKFLFSGCIDTGRIFNISNFNGFHCVDPLFGSLQFLREMYARQMTTEAKMGGVKEYAKFISALTNASGIWMTASYLNHSCLGSHLLFFVFFHCKLKLFATKMKKLNENCLKIIARLGCQ